MGDFNLAPGQVRAGPRCWWDRNDVLAVVRASDGRLHVAIEPTDREAACSGGGCRAQVRDRDRLPLADLPAFGSSVTLVWVKPRWQCREALCPVGSWTERLPDIAPARAAMTTRAGQWATREGGAEKHTVTYAAARLGVASWYGGPYHGHLGSR
jgi:transposase